MDTPTDPEIVVVMGVSGVGKTTVAEGLAGRLGWEFAEGDDFHSEANVAKMRAGTPLTDEDRWPWLRAIRDWMAERLTAGESAVVTSSALRVAYRDVLREAGPGVRFLHLVADEALVEERMREREGHFMPTSLLESQLDTLEPLTEVELDGGSIEVSVEGDPETVLRRSLAALGR